MGSLNAWRQTVALVLACAALCASGCTMSKAVIDPLPSPIVQTWPPTARPATPDNPPAAPAPSPRPVTWSLANRTIVIDPGHGGKDAGAFHHPRVKRYTRLPEKAIVLDIGQRVRELLVARGAKVVMTRTTDRKIELPDRAAMADRHRADLFVSIHADSIAKPGISGATVHIFEKPRAASRHAARSMEAALGRAGISCRGIRGSNLHVLREHSRPSLLVECGYLSNRNDAKKLNDAAYRGKVAAAIADGIASHFTR